MHKVDVLTNLPKLQFVNKTFVEWLKNESNLSLCKLHLYKAWIADAMYWPISGFEATCQQYCHSQEEVVLHRNERNSTLYQLNGLTVSLIPVCLS